MKNGRFVFLGLQSRVALRTIPLLLGCLIFLGPGGCRKETDDEVAEGFYRDQMRLLVEQIGSYARSLRSPFRVIPQNGHELLSGNGRSDGPPAAAYLAAIDAVGREDLFYGYDRDDRSTPDDIRAEWIPFLQLARAQGKSVLVTDYCSSIPRIDDSYLRNAAQGFISFAAHRRELDAIPPHPPVPYQAHAGACTNLAQVKNFLYLINPDSFPTTASFISALQGSGYDLLLIDLFFDGEPLPASAIATLKRKPGGGERLVVAYLSVGEAEDYRYYWKPEWISHPPSWLDGENIDWPGNYKVRYWESGWQEILFGNDQSYVKRIVAAGFDGVYLDLIDAYEYWEDR